MAPHAVTPFKSYVYGRGFTLTGLADATGLPMRRIFLHASGARCLTASELVTVAESLGVNASDLPPNNAPVMRRLVDE